MRHYSVRPSLQRSKRDSGARTSDRISSGSLAAAGLLIAAGIIGGIWVVYDAQYRFALAHNWGHPDIAHIQAAIPEVVWVGMALLGLSQALRGHKSARAISGIVLFFSLSMAAQLLYAQPSPGGYLVAAITPIALALLLETFIDGVYRWACARDGIVVEERPILLRIASALGTLPKLLWVLPAALVVGLLLDFAATWEGLRSWLLGTAVPLAPWLLLALPGAWLLRLALDPKGTWQGIRSWLLDMIPYAPGRTKAQDDARAAEERATHAQHVREEAERTAADLVRQANERADDAIAHIRQEADTRIAHLETAHAETVESMRAEFTELLESERQSATEREDRQTAEHARAVSSLQEQINALTEQASTDVAQVHADAERAREDAYRKFTSQLQTERQHAERQQTEVEQRYRAELERATATANHNARQLRQSNALVDDLREQVATMMAALSGRDRLIMTYQDWERRGDPRVHWSNTELVRALLEEVPTIGLSSVNTACNYLRAYLNERDEPATADLAGVR